MRFVADRLSQVKSSPTLAMTKLSFELKAAGRDVITLSQGEPDFDTEDNVSEAGILAIREHRTKYTAVDGDPALKRAIARKFARDNDLDYRPDEIIVSSGSKAILFNAVMAIVNPGDEVIIPAPYWVSYPDMVRIAGGEPVFVTCAQNNQFRLLPEDLEAAITPRTRMLILCSPNNPSGAAYGKADLRALADVLLRHPHVFVVVDEIYEHLVYDGLKSVSLAASDPGLRDRVLTVNGMSKGYAMTGWRIGFAGGPADVVKTLSTLQSQNVSCPSTIAQAAAIEALDGPQDFIGRNQATFRERRDLVVSMLNRCVGLSCHAPEGAFYVFASCAGCIGRRTPEGGFIDSDEDFVVALLKAEGVAAVHGGAFGLSPYFRISYALSLGEMRDAMERIQRFCASLT